MGEPLNFTDRPYLLELYVRMKLRQLEAELKFLQQDLEED